jgi:hypothetical protein
MKSSHQLLPAACEDKRILRKSQMKSLFNVSDSTLDRMEDWGTLISSQFMPDAIAPIHCCQSTKGASQVKQLWTTSLWAVLKPYGGCILW